MKKLKLDDIPNKTPFVVPDEYFDKLTANIQQEVAEPETINWSLYWKLGLSTVAAACIVMVSFVYFRPIESVSVEQLLAEVSTEDLVNYVAMMDISEELILETLDDTEIDLIFEESMETLDFESTDLDDLLLEFELNNQL